MAYKSGPLSSEFSGYLKNMEKRKKTAKKGQLTRDNLYVRSGTQDPDDYDNRNALQKRRESMTPKRVQEAAREGSGRSGYYDRENEAAIGATKQEFKENSGKVTMNWMQREANQRKAKENDEYKKKYDEYNERKGTATKNARKNISGKLTPAQVRQHYIQENGVDSEDSKKTRTQLNETAGHTIVKNLKENNGRPIIDYRIQQAEQRTKRNKKW